MNGRCLVCTPSPSSPPSPAQNLLCAPARWPHHTWGTSSQEWIRAGVLEPVPCSAWIISFFPVNHQRRRDPSMPAGFSLNKPEGFESHLEAVLRGQHGQCSRTASSRGLNPPSTWLLPAPVSSARIKLPREGSREVWDWGQYQGGRLCVLLPLWPNNRS